MSDEPVSWFYGLIAERVAEFTPAPRQVPFLSGEIERFGQPVLDLGCGVGRLLLPLLGDGVDIDGCDISEDMLRHCRKKALAQGLEPRLYHQPMHALDLPRKYRTIYTIDSFNLAGSQSNGLEALRRCFALLQDGGGLILNIEAEYIWPEEWERWEPARRKTLPEPWPEEGQRRLAASGSEYIERQRTVSFDPLEQRMARQVRIEKWVSGKLVESQELTQSRTLYLPNEMQLMLQIAGFRQISVRGDYTNEPATPDSEALIFTGIK